MHNFLRCLLAIGVFATTTSCADASARSRITEVSEIEIRPGSNPVNMFVEDGRSGMVTEGWRDSGHGMGYPIYTVMVPSSDQRRGWDIVPIESEDNQSSAIVGNARFARGWLDGKPTTFVFTAMRDSSSAIDASKPAPMLIEAYRLVTARPGDKPENAFVSVATLHSSRKFCSPDAAIAHEFDLEGPKDTVKHGSCV